jgi:hypothetical protein
MTTCKLPNCENAARYNSGYCGIHDITENAGQGSLWRPDSTDVEFDDDVDCLAWLDIRLSEICEKALVNADPTDEADDISVPLHELEKLRSELVMLNGDLTLPDGREAEELRSGIERLIKDANEVKTNYPTVDANALQELLDSVDARDSVTAKSIFAQQSDGVLNLPYAGQLASDATYKTMTSCKRCHAVVSDLTQGLCEDCWHWYNEDHSLYDPEPAEVADIREALNVISENTDMKFNEIEGFVSELHLAMKRCSDADRTMRARVKVLEQLFDERGAALSNMDLRIRNNHEATDRDLHSIADLLARFNKLTEQVEGHDALLDAHREGIRNAAQVSIGGVKDLENRFEAFRTETIDEFSNLCDASRAISEDIRGLQADIKRIDNRLHAEFADRHLGATIVDGSALEESLKVIGKNADLRLDEIDSAWRKEFSRIENLLGGQRERFDMSLRAAEKRVIALEERSIANQHHKAQDWSDIGELKKRVDVNASSSSQNSSRIDYFAERWEDFQRRVEDAWKRIDKNQTSIERAVQDSKRISQEVADLKSTAKRRIDDLFDAISAFADKYDKNHSVLTDQVAHLSGRVEDIDLPRIQFVGESSAADLLHPTGRCTCAGEGTCKWCNGAPSMGRTWPDLISEASDGKYTRRYKDLKEEHLMGLIWLLGEFSARMGVGSVSFRLAWGLATFRLKAS